jgi:hypothetical protein
MQPGESHDDAVRWPLAVIRPFPSQSVELAEALGNPSQTCGCRVQDAAAESVTSVHHESWGLFEMDSQLTSFG